MILSLYHQKYTNEFGITTPDMHIYAFFRPKA